MKKFVAVFMIIVLCLPSVCAGLENNEDLDVKKEPIDLVYKYIDLRDENLHREGIPTCKKDYDNEELKYSMRSVLKNIPWVRKIFIIMPNEKVKFLKEQNETSDKIIYIKDKDLLGFDSASSVSFEFNFWRLKDFGCSENFIYMNDDCFIGKPMRKSDFFYKDDRGKVVPYALYNNKVGYGQYDKIKKLWNYLKRSINSANPHSDKGFKYQKLSTFIFLYEEVFKKDIRCPIRERLPHNALGENLTELKEVYDLVQSKYEYADDCLFARFRNNKQLQHQTMYCFYIINKYNREIKKIKSACIDLARAFSVKYNFSLFCINTGGDYNYTKLDYIRAKIKMAELFPERTKYENPDA